MNAMSPIDAAVFTAQAQLMAFRTEHEQVKAEFFRENDLATIDRMAAEIVRLNRLLARQYAEDAAADHYTDF